MTGKPGLPIHWAMGPIGLDPPKEAFKAELHRPTLNSPVASRSEKDRSVGHRPTRVPLDDEPLMGRASDYLWASGANTGCTESPAQYWRIP